MPSSSFSSSWSSSDFPGIVEDDDDGDDEDDDDDDDDNDDDDNMGLASFCWRQMEELSLAAAA